MTKILENIVQYIPNASKEMDFLKGCSRLALTEKSWDSEPREVRSSEGRLVEGIGNTKK